MTDAEAIALIRQLAQETLTIRRFAVPLRDGEQPESWLSIFGKAPSSEVHELAAWLMREPTA